MATTTCGSGGLSGFFLSWAAAGRAAKSTHSAKALQAPRRVFEPRGSESRPPRLENAPRGLNARAFTARLLRRLLVGRLLRGAFAENLAEVRPTQPEQREHRGQVEPVGPQHVPQEQLRLILRMRPDAEQECDISHEEGGGGQHEDEGQC